MTRPQDEQERRTTGHMIPRWLESILACPVCRSSVGFADDRYVCNQCGRTYPVRHGIPDFRLAPDPYISIERELQKIDSLFSGSAKTFEELLAAYYVLSPENPPVLNKHYVSAMKAAVARGRGILRRVSESLPPSRRQRFLDLGCGTGGMLASANSFFPESVGVDVALRWMLMGRQRLRELGVDALMICANAEWLPFAADSFDGVGADAVVEHVSDPERMRDETLRVLRPGGTFFFSTNNRFSALPEPHLRIPGFGLLPRSVMEKAAMALRKTPYKAKLLSLRELRRVFRGTGTISLPDYGPGELGEHNEGMRERWERLTRSRFARAAIWLVSPQFFISGSKSSSASWPVS